MKCDWCGNEKSVKLFGCPVCGCNRCILNVCKDCEQYQKNPVGAECRCCTTEKDFESDF